MSNQVLAKFQRNSGTETRHSFDGVEEAILAYRKARKARRVADRANRFTYSIDGGATWLQG